MTAASMWKRSAIVMRLSLAPFQAERNRRKFCRAAAGGRMRLPAVTFEPGSEGGAEVGRKRVDRGGERLEAPAQRVELIEEVENHGHRLLVDRKLAPQFDDETHARHIDIMEDVVA